MKLHEIKKYLPLIQALAEGKKVEYRVAPDEPWFDMTKEPLPDWFRNDQKDYEWRIKPESKLRPWRPEEVPVGALIRGTIGGMLTSMILAVDSEKVYFAGLSGITFNFIDAGMMGCSYSTDAGKTWKQCGVYE